MEHSELVTQFNTGDQRYKILVECIQDYEIFLLDPSGHILTWNLGVEVNKGYCADEVLGKHFNMFFLLEERAVVPMALLDEAAAEGRSVGEGWRIRKNGEHFWASYVFTAIRDQADRLTCYAAVIQDRNERKKQADAILAMDQELREERDRLHALAESSMDAIYICKALRDASGTIVDFIFTFLNANVEKMVSIPRDVLLGGRVCELMPINRTLGLFDLYCKVVLTGEPLTYEFAIDDADVKSGWIRVQAVKLQDGIAITASDITSRKVDEERIRYLAHHDALTGLPNRVFMDDRIEQAIERARRNGEKVAVFLLDLDSFKPINDGLGHAAGDAVLVSIAKRLKAAVRASDSVIRIGGDEFVTIMSGIGSVADILRCARKMLNSVQQPIELYGLPRAVSGSMGIAIYPDTATTPSELLHCADSAMYAAKRRGRNQFEVFTSAEPPVAIGTANSPPAQEFQVDLRPVSS